MRVLFLNFTRIADGSMNVTNRNIENLVASLEKQGVSCTHASIIVGADKLSEIKIKEIINKKEKYDWIVLVYASFYFYKDALNKIFEINSDAKKCWITTEYEITCPVTKEIDIDLILSNIEEGSVIKKKSKKYLFLDINSLIYNGVNEKINKKYDTIYYGRYRQDRVKYFKKYLNNKDIYLSTSKKNLHKFYQNGIKCNFIDKINWNAKRETLNFFEYSLYIEDIFTHRFYNCPASRFYEAITCNTALLFDDSCENTIKKSGIWFRPEFFYQNKKEITQGMREKFVLENNVYSIETKNKTIEGIYNALYACY